MLTETTAEIAAALTLAAARRVAEADVFMRAGRYQGWLPTLFIGQLLQNKTVGIVGAGRIGAAFARMMVEGHKMDLVYFDPYPNTKLEEYVRAYGEFLEARGERGVTVKRVETVDEVCETADVRSASARHTAHLDLARAFSEQSDAADVARVCECPCKKLGGVGGVQVVSLHCNLDEGTRHLINKRRLELMKPTAVLVNAARGPCVDEAALVAHLKTHPEFFAGLDVFEDEPHMKPGLAECSNAVIVPHIASASVWTRSGMATLAACNVAACLQGQPAYNGPDVLPFVDGPFESIPKMAPSIVNAKDIGWEVKS